MLRSVLLTVAVVSAVVAAGLIAGWGFWFFDDRAWRQHSNAWGWWGAACFASAFHPWVDKAEARANRWYHR